MLVSVVLQNERLNELFFLLGILRIKPTTLFKEPMVDNRLTQRDEQ